MSTDRSFLCWALILELVGTALIAAGFLFAGVMIFNAFGMPSEEEMANRWADLEACAAEPACTLSLDEFEELHRLRQRIREGE